MQNKSDLPLNDNNAMLTEVSQENEKLKQKICLVLDELKDDVLKNKMIEIFTAILNNEKEIIIILIDKYPEQFFQLIFVENRLITPLSLIKILDHQDWLDEINAKKKETLFAIFNGAYKGYKDSQYPLPLDWIIACHDQDGLNKFFEQENLCNFFISPFSSIDRQTMGRYS